MRSRICACNHCGGDARPSHETAIWKDPDGTQVDIYTLKSAAIEARVITYGGIVQSIKVPDKNGKIADVVLGFDSLDGYTTGPKPNPAFFGAIIGRYANRIAGAQFTLDGKTYPHSAE